MGKSIHIDLRFYILRDLVNDEVVTLSYLELHIQIADIIINFIKLDNN